jgi:hypothetical protein
MGMSTSPGAPVVDDQAVVLVACHPVRPRDGLHQRVVAHRLVEIDRRAGRHVEPGDPHRAQEHDPQRVVLILELGLQVLLLHASSMRADVEPLVAQIGDFVLRLRDHHRHVGLGHLRERALDLLPLRLVCAS